MQIKAFRFSGFQVFWFSGQHTGFMFFRFYVVYFCSGHDAGFQVFRSSFRFSGCQMFRFSGFQMFRVAYRFSGFQVLFGLFAFSGHDAGFQVFRSSFRFSGVRMFRFSGFHIFQLSSIAINIIWHLSIQAHKLQEAQPKTNEAGSIMKQEGCTC